VKDRPGHDRRYALDISKAKSELGWRPVMDFREGLKKTIRWYLANEKWWRDILSGDYRDFMISIIGADVKKVGRYRRGRITGATSRKRTFFKFNILAIDKKKTRSKTRDLRYLQADLLDWQKIESECKRSRLISYLTAPRIPMSTVAKPIKRWPKN
jgi:hypothetical protein